MFLNSLYYQIFSLQKSIFFTKNPGTAVQILPHRGLLFLILFSDPEDPLGIFHPLFCGRFDSFQSVGTTQSLPFENSQGMIRQDLHFFHIFQLSNIHCILVIATGFKSDEYAAAVF